AKKGKGRSVDDKDTPVPQPAQAKRPTVEQEDSPEPTQPSSQPRSKSAAVQSSRAITPQARAASQPATQKPRPRPIPKKIHRQPSPTAMDDDLEIVDMEVNAADNHGDATNAMPPASSPPQADAEQTDVDGTMPSSQDHRHRDDGDMTHGMSDPTPPCSPSPFHGFSTTDTTWFDPDSDDNDMQHAIGINEHDGHQDIMTDIDECRGDDLVPTQPLTPVSQSPSPSEHRVPTSPPPPPPPVKRQRAPTTNSNASSTSGRGRMTKKKAKVALADDAEVTVIPGI
ncbi:hypothetical protein BDR04DRAFT_1163844, partial [Suillus decipiens]